MAAPGFLRGVKHALDGFRLIRAPGVRRYVIVPFTINLVLFVSALYAVGATLDWALAEYLASWPEWTHWLLWIVFGLLAAVLVFFTFTLVANIVASPFNGMLAEAVERHLDPHSTLPEMTWQRMLAEAARALAAELRKLLYIGLRAIPLLVLSIIPVVNVIAPALWVLFGAWMLCLEYLDCPLGNHGRVFPAVLGEMRGRRRLALGFGGAVTLMTMVPVLNFLAMPVGVAGATSLYVTHVAGRGAAEG